MVTAPCGIANYFKHDKDMCRYQQMAYSLSNFYHIIDNWTYFPVHPNVTEKIYSTCITDVKNLGPIPIRGQGAHHVIFEGTMQQKIVPG